MLKFKIYSRVIICFAIIGCGKNETSIPTPSVAPSNLSENNSERAVATAPSQDTEQLDAEEKKTVTSVQNLEANVQGVEKTYGQYRVFLKWKCHYGEGRLIDIVRQDLRELITEYVDTVSCNRESHTHLSKDDKEYFYKMVPKESDYDLKVEGIKVVIPKDLALDGEFHWNRRVRPNRLFLYNRAVLYIGTQNVDFDLEEMVSENGQIAAFPINATASLNTAGKSAGNLFIKTDKAYGTLTVRLNGEHGGNGIKGADGRNGKEGAKGADGYSAKFNCPKLAESGHPGESGENGQPGGNGSTGGNAGRIWLEVSEDSPHFTYSFEQKGGNGGLGGVGGNGGAGGKGGQPGVHNHFAFSTCEPKLSVGANGSPGASGKNGLDGMVGQSKTYCYKTMNRVYGDCEHASTL